MQQALGVEPPTVPISRQSHKVPAADAAPSPAFAPCGKKDRLCHRCKIYYELQDGYETGKAKTFKCKGCNALEGRIRTIKQHSGKHFEESWDKMDPEALASFMQKAKDLAGTQLAEQMNVHVEMFRESTGEVSTGLPKFEPNSLLPKVQ